MYLFRNEQIDISNRPGKIKRQLRAPFESTGRMCVENSLQKFTGVAALFNSQLQVLRLQRDFDEGLVHPPLRIAENVTDDSSRR